ncbi:MAG: hypothetical protein QOF70_7395 [Acetobacteraceae bacterium]|nr:hypothetical protein [Acetobacteraceae bacterium]
MRRLKLAVRATVVVLVVCLLAVTPPASAQPYNVCFDLLEPLWHPPQPADAATCLREPLICLIMPHCCFPDCALHPECIAGRALAHEGSWERRGGTTCEILPIDRIGELWVRRQLAIVDDVVAPGVKDYLYTQILQLEATASPIPTPVKNLLAELLGTGVGAGTPRFDRSHIENARVTPNTAPPSSLFLRPGYDAITLDRLIVMRNDTPTLFTDLFTTSLPPDVTLRDLQTGGRLFGNSFVTAFVTLSHELVHVRQVAEMGADAFYNNYLLEWARSGLKYASGDPFEAEAYTYENAVAAYLASSPLPPPFRPNAEWTEVPFFGTRGTFFADVDGDGKADAIVSNDGLNGRFTVRLSTASGFAPNADWTDEPFFGTRGTFFADVNGDGKADAIVSNDGDAGRVVVRLSTGTGFAPNEEWTEVPFFGSRGTFFADVNGDGKADAIVSNDGNAGRVVVRSSR